MTHIVRISLGTSPGCGTQAFNQATAFKRQLRSVLPAADGAWLVTVDDDRRLGVEAVYDAHTPGAEAWVDRAAEVAPEIWRTLAERRAARGR